MIYGLWLLPLVGIYALTAWIKSVIDWRISFLNDALLKYVLKKEEICESNT